MSYFYLHKGYLPYVPDSPEGFTDLIVSVGTLEEPATVYFKTMKDMLAYCHGHQECLNDQGIKDRYKQITKDINSTQASDVIFPKWVSKKKILRLRILKGIREIFYR